MFPKEEIPAILKEALSRGGDYAELYFETGEHAAIALEESRIEKVITGSVTGVGLRVLHQGRTVYAYTNDLSPRSVRALAGIVNRAIQQAPQERVTVLSALRSPVDFPIRRDPAGVETKEKVAQVLAADAAARRIDSRICQASIVYADSHKEVLIANSLGDLAEDHRVSLMGRVQVLARQNDTLQTGLETTGGAVGFELFDADPLEAVATRAARRSVLMLDAAPAPAGRMPVILSAEAGGTMIHEAVGHGLEMDLAQQGLSVYSGRLGESIASPRITVVDDATLPNRRGSFRFDDEAVVGQRTVLIERGTLKAYMNDRLTAAREGVPLTGNGRRESYRCRPIPRMTNTMILSGTDDPAAILASTPTGLFVVRMGGGQVNTVNGDFVFEVSEGYRIENGRVGEPVRGATLTGSGPTVLMEIDRVGTDLGFAIGTCGKDGQGAPVADAQPTIRIPEITVGGRV